MDIHSTWETIELPLLHAIRLAEIEGREPDLPGFFEERAIPDARAASVIDRLREGDLITGTFYKTLGSVFPRFFADVRLTAAGARAVGMWPTADPAHAFIAALEAAIGQADSPESRSRLSKALDALAEVPAAVLTGILVQAGMKYGLTP
jgi:hypothetical protein